jgi:small GTP-binding protein
MDIKRLTEIAGELGFSDLQRELQTIDARNSKENCPLVIPLVGEFSSGKTTLINSLTDSKKMETATKPTTATIYEVHFGAEKCHAKVTDAEGNTTDIEDLTEMKNDVLKDAKVVTVFDTSKRVPSTTILVDTPGLSSPDPKHKQTLVDFIPQADAILLVSDVNQQVTRSLTDFVKTMSLSKKPIYLVLTKSDTKSASELENARKYASENIHIAPKNICCVSANADSLDELYKLFSDIQLNKSKILKEVNEQRIKNIVSTLLSKIDDLLNSTNNDASAEDAIRRQKHELDKLNRNIDKLIDSTREDIEECGRSATRSFEDTIYNKLDTLVAGKSNNFDADAVSAINSTSSLILSEFKSNVGSILRRKAQEKVGTDDAVNLHSLSDIDLSQYSVDGISYNLNLNTVGHEYDGYIATGIKVAATVATVTAVASKIAGAIGGDGGIGSSFGDDDDTDYDDDDTGGGDDDTDYDDDDTGGGDDDTDYDDDDNDYGDNDTDGGAAAEGDEANAGDGDSNSSEVGSNDGNSTAVNVSTAANVASAAVGIGAICSNRSIGKKLSRFASKYSNIQYYNENVGQQVGLGKGIVESMVGFVTDKTMGKPQRRKAIHEYMDGTLMPEFNSEISRIITSLTTLIRNCLHQEASYSVAEMTKALNELQKAKAEKADEYNNRISKLRDYKKELSII